MNITRRTATPAAPAALPTTLQSSASLRATALALALLAAVVTLSGVHTLADPADSVQQLAAAPAIGSRG
jgi:hypothetical protein